MEQPSVDEIIENFELMEEWDDRYRYLIELGRALPPLPEAARNDANKVRGCASQVWLATSVKPNGSDGPVLAFDGDSDAHIVRGLIAILFALYSGKGAQATSSPPTPSTCSKSSGCVNTSPRNARTASARWSTASAATPTRRSRR